MNKKNTIYIILALLIISCQNDDFKMKISKNCCDKEGAVKGAFAIRKDLSITNNLVNDEKYAIFYPNIFTPNRDKTNDSFFVMGKNLSVVEMRIYDEENLLVTTITKPKTSWDGFVDDERMLQGKYGYEVDMVNSENEEITFHGSFCLRRGAHEECNDCIYPDQLDSAKGAINSTNDPFCK